jgi:hypothetical protein
MNLAPAAHIDVALEGRYATRRIAYRDLLKKAHNSIQSRHQDES